MKKLIVKRYTDNGNGFRDLRDSETAFGLQLSWYFSNDYVGFTDSNSTHRFQKFISGLVSTLDGERIGMRIKTPDITRFYRSEKGFIVSECTLRDINTERLKRFVLDSKRVYLSISSDSYFPHMAGKIVTLTKKKPNSRLYTPIGTMELIVL